MVGVLTAFAVLLVGFIGLGPQWGGGFRFVLDPGQEFTKTDLYKLTIGEFTVTWGP